jgi:hypothetical protein
MKSRTASSLADNSLSALILRRLVVSPTSLIELQADIRAGKGRVRQIIRELVEIGEIQILMDPRREGGPFYCLPGYGPDEDQPDPRELSYDYRAYYENPLLSADDPDGSDSATFGWS